METERIKIAEMPAKEVLEAFLTAIIMGTEVSVRFNAEEGVFESDV